MGDDKMEGIMIASEEQLEDIVSLRIEMQIEDWNTTLNQDFSYFADPFANITRKHIQERLNQGRHGRLVSAYTRPEFRGRGYQQNLTEYLLDFAKKKNFMDITLTTNTPDAAHIYEKSGFHQTSSKYFLSL